MKKDDALSPRPVEIELKLALQACDPAELEKKLAGMPGLARRKPSRLQLHNTYYDTPEQTLRRKRMALRLRRVGSDAKPEWLQTLKMGGIGNSALSQRGEWETSVPSGELDLPALEATPWIDIDPHGDLFRKLAPCFVTSFDRTSWTVRKPGGSIVEVSLDVGQIVVESKSIPICELELELLAGQPSALFGLARQIARSISVMPETRSKAERGYALAEGSLDRPLRAQPPPLHAKMVPAEAAQCVLQEMFCQFTANLNTLRHSNVPEVLHQARVGWRRFRSAYRLFKPVLDADTVPSWEPLKTLLMLVGELWDLDVARTETLPKLADAYMAGNVRREEKWQALNQALTQSADVQRKAICYALEVPSVGAALLGITQWLEELPQQKESRNAQDALDMSFRRWARHRIARLHKQLTDALQDADTLEGQHRARILAKRTRYGIEALKPLLNRQRTKRWYRQATDLQTNIGMARDVVQANLLVVKVQADHELAEFLRGVAVGQERSV